MIWNIMIGIMAIFVVAVVLGIGVLIWAASMKKWS